MEQHYLLQQYRGDRRKLLSFLLSSGLIKELRTPAGPATSLSGIDFDALSADYVLDCVKSGGVIDVSLALEKYFDKTSYPIMIHSQLRDSYFLLSDPDLSGSPPRRRPPPTNASRSRTADEASCSLRDEEGPVGDTTIPSKPIEEIKLTPLGLPNLNTGLKDDDLRESAYEILLASMAFSGIQVYSVEDRTTRGTPKKSSGMKSKRVNVHTQSQSLERPSNLVGSLRVQLQISEAMDACTRKRLMELVERRVWRQIDVPQVSLRLLYGVLRSDFYSEKLYMQWKFRQVSILEELLCYSSDLEASDLRTIKNSLSKIRNQKEWDIRMSLSERTEVLTDIWKVTSRLSGLPGKTGIQGETYYWTAGYHLNIRLYEKLLFGVFDTLDEGQLTVEADDVLKFIKLTWSTLGITHKMHNLIYGWVLFQQFVETDEVTLLDHAIHELQKSMSAEGEDENEGRYLRSLTCPGPCNDSGKKLSLVQAIFFSISSWCDCKLQDYHRYFSQKPTYFERVIDLLSAVGVVTSLDCGDIELWKLNALNEDAVGKVKTYVESSIDAACARVASKIDFEPKMENIHPLALLAIELRVIAVREIEVFFPVLHRWCPESGIATAMKLHRLYGEKLRPFLNDVSCLSKDVRSVLPAAHLLDRELTHLFTLACKESRSDPLVKEDLEHYPIGDIAKPILLDWLIDQHASILEWTGRALDLEDWEPLSIQQKHAASVVEVFRIIEETVDQFFGLNLPMDITHLQTLLSVIFHTLDAYLLKLPNQLVEKCHLYPSIPPLTRFEETFMLVSKKKFPECILDEYVSNQLNDLTISKLCIRLNTLKYIQKQTGILEDGIKKLWILNRKSASHNNAQEGSLGTMDNVKITSTEDIDELFVTTFGIIRDSITNAISKICDFIGSRVIFWDLRGAYISFLYRGNVEGARLDDVLPHIDDVLDRLCGLIDDTLRDLVVSSIFRASLEGFIWVLLNGGPSRVFADADFQLMKEDFNVLKEFFVADGNGLSHSLVEKEAKSAEEILDLYSLQTSALIQMLMSASEQILPDSHPHSYGRIRLDAQALIRVLCHKKDKEASKFLKRQYHLPSSSEYDDSPSKDSISR